MQYNTGIVSVKAGTEEKTCRVGVYVDGFSLYFGLKAAKRKHLYWLNIRGLARAILAESEELCVAKYFTARIDGRNEAKRKRQAAYLDALGSVHGLEIIMGKYAQRPRTCELCGGTFMVPEEKMSDINLSVHLLMDAMHNMFDCAIIISGDSDQTATVRAIKDHFPAKRIEVAFPPNRFANELKANAHAVRKLTIRMLENCRLADEIRLRGGHVVTCPPDWA